HQQLRLAIIGSWLRNLLHPLASSEDSNRDCETKEGLTHGGMCARNRRREKVQHRHPAEDSLQNDSSESTEGQGFHPPAPFHEPRPEPNRDGAQAREPRNHTVTVLVDDAAHPWGQSQQMAVGSRPVGY